MKRLLFAISFFISINSVAQKYILIDRKLKQPIQDVDNVNQEQSAKGFFPIEKAKIDSFIDKLNIICERLLKVGREKYDEFIWKVGATTFNGKVIKWNFGDRFNIAISTDTGNGYSSSYYISDARKMNKENAAYLKRLIAYIKNSK